MKSEPLFLTIDHVLAIHDRMIREFGGSPETRDRGLLESAVIMPQAKFSGRFLHPSVPAMGAAYLFHICKNHPFVDGNKRTALAAAIVFLSANDFYLLSADRELERVTLAVADGTLSKEELTAFFIKEVSKRSR